MNSKEIDLILRARLDSSSAESDAQALGSSLGAALEQAFSGVGDRIAETIISQIQSKLGQADFGRLLLGSSSGTQGYGVPDNFVGPKINPNEPKTSNNNSSYQVQQQGDPNKGLPPLPGPMAPESFSHPNFSPPAHKANPTSGFASLLLNGFFQNNKDEATPSQIAQANEQASAHDIDVNKYTRYKNLKKAGYNVNLNHVGLSEEKLSDLRNTTQDLVKDSSAQVNTLENSIKELSTTIIDLTRKYQEAKDEPTKLAAKEILDSQKALKEAKQFELGEKSALVAKGIEAGRGLGQDATGGYFSNPENRAKFGQGFAVAGQAVQFAGNYHYMDLANQSGYASNQYMGTRDMTSGNREGMLAAQFGGGYDEMRSHAKFGAGADVVAKIGTGAAEFGLGVMSGPNPFGAMMGITGASTMMSGAKDAMEYQNAVAQKMRTEQGNQYTKNQEYIDMYSKSRSNNVAAYGDAKSLGSSSYSQFLTGYNADGSRGILQDSSYSGLTTSEIKGGLRSYAHGMGGVYGDTNVLEQLGSQIKQGNNLKGLGFSNIEDVSSALFRGGYAGEDNTVGTRSAAMEGAQQRYGNYNAAGLEGSSSVQLLQTMANKAGSSLDAGAGAAYAADVSASYAGTHNMGNANQTQFVNRMVQGSMDMTNTGDGIGGIAKFRAMQDLEKQLGRKLSYAERYAVQKGEMGTQAMELLMNKDGKKHDAKEVSGNIDMFNKSRRDNLLETATISFGDKDFAKVWAAEQSGTKDSFEMLTGGNVISGYGAKPGASPIKDAAAVKAALSKTPGAPETVQDTKNEIIELSLGMKTLSVGFKALEEASHKAAGRLAEVAGTKPALNDADRKTADDASAAEYIKGKTLPDGTTMPGAGLRNFIHNNLFNYTGGIDHRDNVKSGPPNNGGKK